MLYKKRDTQPYGNKKKKKSEPKISLLAALIINTSVNCNQ